MSRSASFRATVQPLVRDTVMRGSLDFRRAIAHASVAVFAISLFIPMLLYDVTRTNAHVLVATANGVRLAAVSRIDFSLPNQVAQLSRTILAQSAPAVAVMASWYGPGFYENRLPCWLWLQMNCLPIQFLPDTWGVAHKTLPCGTMLPLTYGGNTITLPVVDRGPYVAGREIDLSPRVKAALGCADLCTVVMQIL